MSTTLEFSRIVQRVYTPSTEGRLLNMSEHEAIVFHRIYDRLLVRHEDPVAVRKLYPVTRTYITSYMTGEDHVPDTVHYHLSRGLFILLIREVWPTLAKVDDYWLQRVVNMHHAGTIYTRIADEVWERLPTDCQNLDEYRRRVDKLHQRYVQAALPLGTPPASNTGVTYVKR